MATLAIVGASPGLGAAAARRFGREGFSVALIARDQAKLDALVAQLAEAAPARQLLGRRARRGLTRRRAHVGGGRTGRDHRPAVQPAPPATI